MTAGTLVIALVAISLVGAETVAMLALAMLAFGVGQIFSNVATQTLIANGGKPEQRDERFGTQSVVVSLGQLVGPVLAGLIVAQAIGDSETSASGAGAPVSATNGVFILGAVAGLLAMLAAASLWWRPPREHSRTRAGAATAAPTKESTLSAVRRVLHIPSIPQAMLASMAVLSCIDLLIVYLPVYGVANAVPVATIGLLLAIRAIASMSARILMLPLLRRLGRKRLLLAGMLTAATMFAVLPLGGANVLTLAICIAMIGGGLGLCQPLTTSWVATQAPSEIRGTAVGVRLSGNRFAQFAIPLLAGLIAGSAGLLVVFWSLAALLAVSAGFVNGATFTPVVMPGSSPSGGDTAAR